MPTSTLHRLFINFQCRKANSSLTVSCQESFKLILVSNSPCYLQSGSAAVHAYITHNEKTMRLCYNLCNKVRYRLQNVKDVYTTIIDLGCAAMNVPCEFFLFSASVQASLETSSTVHGVCLVDPKTMQCHQMHMNWLLSATSKFMDC